MITKNLITLFCLVIFILASQSPASAGPLKRSALRVIKWGVCLPVNAIGLFHAAPGLCVAWLGGHMFERSKDAIRNDLEKDKSEK